MSNKFLLALVMLAASASATAGERPRVNCPKTKPLSAADSALRHRIRLDASSADDAGFDIQWALARIGAPAAWTRTKGDSGTLVAVVDSGIDLAHPDLMGRVWTHQPDESAEQGSVDQQAIAQGMQMIHGANFFGGPERHPCDLFTGRPPIALPCDAHGHGTAVASIIAAQTGNAIGIAGVAWYATILPVKFFDEYTDNCKEPCVARTAAQAIDYAAKQRAKIINLSWGGGDDDPQLRAALKALEEKPVLVVAAAGNLHADIDCEPHYPASYALRNMLVVGSSDSEDKLCLHSNFGSKVDLYAPGCGVAAAELHGGYGTKAGTSIAAPHAAGAAVLLMHLAPTWSPIDIKRYLVESADHPATLHLAASADKKQTPLPRLNVDRATSAPVVLDPNLENTTWEREESHTVAWKLPFDSIVCPAGELRLISDDGKLDLPIKTASGSDLHTWSNRAAQVNVHHAGVGPWHVRIVARCPGTTLTSTSQPFTLL